MKRIKLTHGTARVQTNCPQEIIDALNEVSRLVYEHNTTVVFNTREK